tara:strand:+ start:16310 stop:16621 length:312 start_codon:yes stop_codon:yes gene_type:complete
MEQQIGLDFPPPISHPEYFYGFVGVTLAWQILFLVLSTDPVRYRIMMLPSILEKLSYVVAVGWLFALERVGALVFNFAVLNLLLAVLFVVSYLKTCPASESST